MNNKTMKTKRMKRIPKPKLVPNWKQGLKFWSTRISIVGASLATLLITSTDAAKWAWDNLPADLKSAIPPQYTPLIGIGIVGLSWFARIVQQTKLQKQLEQSENGKT